MARYSSSRTEETANRSVSPPPLSGRASGYVLAPAVCDEEDKIDCQQRQGAPCSRTGGEV